MALVLSSCVSKGAPKPSPGPDLFEKAEQDSARIAERIEQKRSRSAKEKEEQIIESEDENRARAIQKYRSLLARKDRLDRTTREISMLNLAHLIFEQCLARYRKEMQRYDQAYKQYQLGYVGTPPAEIPRYDFQQAREAYEAFLEAFPDSKHRAEVLYNLAYSYEEEGDLDKAVSLYDELALTAPDAQFAPEVYMRLGEHSFETNRFEKAIEYYEKVLALGTTPFYDKALFKIGWSLYAMNQYEPAKDAFARILDLSMPRKGTRGGDLYQESLEILAKILSETGGARALESFLKGHGGPPYGLDLSVKLGDHFQETARYQEAIDTYRKILERYPNSPQAPFVEQSLIQCLKTDGRSAEAETLQATLVDRYGKGTAWAHANPDPELRKRVDHILWEALHQQILAHHKSAREKKDAAEYEKTIALYRKALESFPEGEESYETRFLFAECLFESGRLQEAAEQYAIVSKVDTYTRYREKAASKRIQCLETLRKTESIDVATLLAAYRDYRKLHPGTERATALLFKEGEILFNTGQHDEAARIFRQIIESRPKNPNVLRAWILELEALFEAGRYPELEQRAREFRKKRFSLTDKQRDRTEHLLRFAQFEQAHADQEAGNYSRAASRYEKLVQEAPRIEIAPDALFNAALCYEKAGKPGKAATCFEKIVAQYPASKHYSEALLAPLPYYEKTGQWDRLLVHLEMLHRKDPNSTLAKEALYKLAKRFYKNGNHPKAREIFALYKSYYPKDIPRRLEIAYLDAQMSEREGHKTEALEGYRRFLKDYGRARARDPSVSPDPLYVATARFRVLEPLYADYRSIELREPLKRNLSRKQSALDRVLSGYMEIAKSGVGEYALASAFRVGEAYETFWRSLLDSEIPGGLSEEETRVYKELLEKQAAPYRDKALAAYQVTMEKASEKGVFNEWVLRTYSHLSSLDPGRYPPLLQDSLVWKETWKGKRSLIRTIDRSAPRGFSQNKAAKLQAELDRVLKELREQTRSGRLGRKKVQEAIQALQALLDKEPGLYEVHFNLGILYEMLGENAKAREEYERSLDQHPRNPVAHLNLGLIYLSEGNLRKALLHFQELALLTPRYAGAYYLQGVCHSKQGAFRKAIDPLEKAILLLPQFLDPYVELARAQVELGQNEQARKNFLAVLNHPKASPRVLRALGYRLLQIGWTEESIKAYDRVLAGEKALYGDWNNRGVAYLRKGDWKRAQEDISRALQIDPRRPEAYNNLGRIYLEQKDYGKALSAFTQALETGPSLHAALLNAAVVSGQYLHDMEKASALFQRYLDQGGTLNREVLRGWLSGSWSRKTEKGAGP